MPDRVRLTCPKCGAEWESADRPGSIATCAGCGNPVKVTLPTVVPTGERDRCPACGSGDSVPLGDKAIEAFYAAYKQKKSPFLLFRPRKCQACGQRWEVNPPRWALVGGIAILGVGLVLCLAGAVVCALWAADSEEPAKSGGLALTAFAAAVGCGYGIRHYVQKLRTAGRPPGEGDSRPDRW